MAEASSTPPGNTDEELTAERKRAQTRERVRRHREQQADPTSTKVGSRPGRQPGPTKANPFAFGPGEGLGDPLGVPETKRNLVHAHLAIARIMRSTVNFDELDDEFDSAAAAYADISNHLLPWLRILPRIIAPLVLVGALIVIWGAMLVRTPWLQRWWQRRKAEAEAREAAAQLAAAQEAAERGNPTVTPVRPPGPAQAGTEEPIEHPPVPVLVRGALSKR